MILKKSAFESQKTISWFLNNYSITSNIQIFRIISIWHIILMKDNHRKTNDHKWAFWALFTGGIHWATENRASMWFFEKSLDPNTDQNSATEAHTDNRANTHIPTDTHTHTHKHTHTHTKTYRFTDTHPQTHSDSRISLRVRECCL